MLCISSYRYFKKLWRIINLNNINNKMFFEEELSRGQELLLILCS